MTEHSFNKSNRYSPTRTIEEQSARVTKAVIFSLKGATLTMTDALKIAAAARECIPNIEEAPSDEEVQKRFGSEEVQNG